MLRASCAGKLKTSTPPTELPACLRLSGHSDVTYPSFALGDSMSKNYLTKHVQLTDRGADGYGSLLHCPACGHNYTHHGQVDVYDRAEDSTGVHTRIDGSVTTDTNMAGNPSSRRHGLTVAVTCEGCGAESLLGLEQHKGETFLRWLRVGQTQR